MSRVTIGPATLRDMTWIGGNLREADAREIFCQVPEGTLGSSMAASVFLGLPEAWTRVATLDGQPVAAFGFQPFTVPVWIAWAWGTRRMTRAIPAITRWCWSKEPELLELGVRRVEARSIAGHEQAHRWLERLGCRREADLPDHGRNGELFHLYAWTIGNGRPTQRHSYRTNRNVSPETPEGAEADPAASAPVENGG